MPNKEKRITVRLSESSIQKLEDAKNKGYTTSNFVNDLISSSVISDIGLRKNIMIHICKIQSELEFEQDPEIKRNMREELNEVCRCLNLSPNHMTTQMPSEI